MKKIILVIGFLCVGLVANAQQSKISSEIKENIKSRIAIGDNVGIVVGYIEGDAIEYFSFGKTSIENGSPVDEHSVFEIGSISKVFTTILLADQVLQGKMKLSDPISKYLPEDVKVPSSNGTVITLKDLATHSSGLPRLPDNMNPKNPNNPYADYTVEQAYSFLSGHQLRRDVGASFEYSNYGMGLLGHILALHTNKSYETLMVDKIANTYGMENTRVGFTKAMKQRLAAGHAFGQEVENWDLPTLVGAGGIRSTAADMIKFLKANIGDEASSIAKAMRLSHKLGYSNDDQNFEMGLGWHYAQGKIIWHNGGTGGYRAFAGFVEGSNRGVVVLTNSIESVDDIGLKILDATRKLKIPKKKEEKAKLQLPEELLEKYVGVYELAPTFSITVTREGAKLFIQATGQQRFEVFASAETEFYLEVVEASITFNADESDEITSLTLHQGGQHVPGKKVK